MADDEEKVLQQARKLALEERIAHKLWKARKEAYAHMLSEVTRNRDTVEAQYAQLAPSIVSDSNQGAQEVACDVVLALLDGASTAGVPDAAALGNKLVWKGLNSRPGIVKKVGDIFLALVEHGQASEVVSALSGAFSHKVPKIGLAALDIVLQGVQAFGTGVVPAKQVMLSLPPVFDAKDAKVRSKGKEIVLELAKWVGANAVRGSIMEKMRDTQKAEVEGWLAEQPASRPSPSRLTVAERAKQQAQAELTALDGSSAPSQQQQQQAAAAPAAAPGAAPNDFGDELDAYDLSDPVDVLSSIPKAFWKDVQDPKWSIRRDALVSLGKILSVPRAATGNYHDVVGALKKVIAKDSNAACVAEALKCVSAACKSLRSAFSNFAKGTFLALSTDKLKDTNAAVQRASTEALHAMQRYCFLLHEVAESVAAAVVAPAPKARQLLLSWLVECIDRESAADVKKLHSTLLPEIVKLASDAVPATRDAAMFALAKFADKGGGLQAISQHTANLDARRVKQLQDLTRAGDAPQKPSSLQASPTRPSTAAAPHSSRPARNASVPARPKTAQPARPKTGSVVPKSAAKGTSEGSEAAGNMSMPNMSMDECKAALEEAFGAATLGQLSDLVWKARLEGMQAVQDQLPGLDLESSGTKVAYALCHIPGWKDTNFQVVTQLCHACTHIADKAPTFGKGDAAGIATGATDKISDIKLKQHVCELLSTMSEVVSLHFVMSQVYKHAKAHKNPKVFQEAVLWMAKSTEEFGITAADVKSLTASCKEVLSHTNANVRQAGVELAAVMHRFLGDSIDGVLSADVKPAMMQNVRAAWANDDGTAPVAVRTVRSAAPAKKKAGVAAAAPAPLDVTGAASSEPEVDPLDGLPRTDISGQLSDSVMAQLGSTNWKERKAGVEAVEQIVKAAGGRIEPSVGGLMSAMKPLMADSNRNLAAQAVRLAAQLVQAMGRQYPAPARPLLLSLLKNVNDSKPAVRTATLDFIHTALLSGGWNSLDDALASTLGSPKCTATGKVAIVEAMAKVLDSGHAPRDAHETSTALNAAAAALSDKTIEPRKSAAALLTSLAAAVPPAQLRAAAAALPAEQRVLVQDQLAKSGCMTAPPSPTPAEPARAPVHRSPQARPATAPRRAAVPSTRPGTAGSVRPGTARSESIAAAQAAPLGGGADEELIRMAEESKENRRLPQRSFRFEVRNTEVTDVQSALQPYLSSDLASWFFSKDFKLHCKACDAVEAQMDQYLPAIISVLDLIFRWAVLRFCDEKLQSMRKVQVLLLELLYKLGEVRYQATDNEANVLVPCLCEKVGHNQDRVRAGFVDLLTAFQKLHNPHRMCVFLMEALGSKNMKSRADCADQLTALLRVHGTDIMYRGSRSKRTCYIPKTLAALTAERDSGVRQAALGTLMAIYEQVGSKVWDMLGGDSLPAKQRDLIAERIKYVDRNTERVTEVPSQVTSSRAGSESPAFRPRTSPAVNAAAQQQQRNWTASPSAPDHNGTLPPDSPMRSYSRLNGSARSINPARAASPPALPLAMAGMCESGVMAAAEESSMVGPPDLWTREEDSAAAREPHSPVRVNAHMLEQPRPETPDVPLRHAGGVGGVVRPNGAFGAAPRSPDAQSDVLPTPRPGAAPSPVAPELTAGKSEEDYAERYFAAFDVLKQDTTMTETTQVTEAMKSIFFTVSSMAEHISDSAVVSLMDDNVNELAYMLYARKKAFTDLSESYARGGQPNPLRSLRYLSNTLCKCYDFDHNKQIDRELTHTLCKEMLAQLADHIGLKARFEAHAPELMRLMNVLMCKILESANKNSAIHAILNCDCDAPEEICSRGGDLRLVYHDLVGKCILKMIRPLPNFVDLLDLEVLAIDVHTYYERSGDPHALAYPHPYRAFQRFLNELCKHRGLELLQTARRLELAPVGPQGHFSLDSNVERVCRTLHQAGLLPALPSKLNVSSAPASKESTPTRASANSHPLADNDLAADSVTEGAAPPQETTSGMPPPPPPTGAAVTRRDANVRGTQPLQSSNAVNTSGTAGAPDAHVPDELKPQIHEIFTIMANLSTFKLGCERLYDLCEANPHLDVGMLLARTSETFKSHVDKRFQRIRLKRQKVAESQQHLSGNGRNVAPESASDVASLRARLAKLEELHGNKRR